MKTTRELEEVEVYGVKLDVYFQYDDYFGFTFISIESPKDVQDLTPILCDSVIDKIEEILREKYRSNGWL